MRSSLQLEHSLLSETLDEFDQALPVFHPELADFHQLTDLSVSCYFSGSFGCFPAQPWTVLMGPMEDCCCILECKVQEIGQLSRQLIALIALASLLASLAHDSSHCQGKRRKVLGHCRKLSSVIL